VERVLSGERTAWKNKVKNWERESMVMIVEIEFLVIDSNCLNGHAEQYFCQFLL